MKLKKIITAFLLIVFTMCFTPIIGASSNQESLSEFLKNTDNIKASFKYPSMKLAATTGVTNLPAHTPVIIRANDTITTRDVVSGSTVEFTVVGDVIGTNGVVLIKSGTPASAQISFSKSRGRIGRSGELTVSDFHTIAVDGSYVPLSGTMAANPDDKMVLSVCLGVIICPLFLLMRGEDAQLPAGIQKTVYTVTNLSIKASRI